MLWRRWWYAAAWRSVWIRKPVRHVRRIWSWQSCAWQLPERLRGSPTYGWRRHSPSISLSQLSPPVGASRHTIYQRHNCLVDIAVIAIRSDRLHDDLHPSPLCLTDI